MDKVKYRLNDPRLAPRRTRLEIPGWAGKREPRANGSREQVWHCVPFSEGAQYGIELFYPYDNELHVTTRDGHLVLEGDWGPPPDGGCSGRHSGISAILSTPIRSCSISRSRRAWRSGPNRTRASIPTHRYRADRGAGAGAQLVADDVLLRVQGAGRGPHPYFQAERAVRADHRDPRGSQFRARTDERGRIRRARTAGAADLSTAGRRFRPGPNGRRRPTPCSTAPIGICIARRRKKPGRTELSKEG